MVQRPCPDLRGGCAAMRIPTATAGGAGQPCVPTATQSPVGKSMKLREGRRCDRTKAVLTHPLERVPLLGVAARSKFYSLGATP